MAAEREGRGPEPPGSQNRQEGDEVEVSLELNLTDDAQDGAEAAKPVLSLGWLVKGLVFVVVGVLAVELARRGRGSADADQKGALAALAEPPAGRVVVLAVSVGLLLYAAWKLWSAAVDDDDGVIGVAGRVGSAGLALVYGLLAATGIQIVFAGSSGRRSSGGAPTSSSELTATLLEVPGGRIAVVGIGLGTAAVGVYQLQRAVRGRFLDEVDTSDLPEWRHLLFRTLGTVGTVARTLVLGVTGWLFVEAARQHQPDKAAGLDQALRALASAPFGRIVLVLCGVGLGVAGLYDMATFRRRKFGDDDENDDGSGDRT